MKNTCNQCFQNMTEILKHPDVGLCVCRHATCPNYALVQVPIEDMTERDPNPTPHE